MHNLHGKGFTLRALTRKPKSDKARALAGAWGVYAVQNTWEAGVEGEEEQGKRIAELAQEFSVTMLSLEAGARKQA
jgi:hypothetical protein